MLITILEPLSIHQSVLDDFIRPFLEAGHEVRVYDTKPQSKQAVIERAKGAHILILANTPLPDDVLENEDQLRLVAVAFTGFDHVNVKKAAEKGIYVSNASGYATQSVAEWVIGVALWHYRQLGQGDRVTRQGGSLEDYYQGQTIQGKRVGIIGTGLIGQATAKLFLAFGAEVVAYSRSEKKTLLDLGISYLPLEQLLKTADIVSLHLPLKEDTYHAIGRKELSWMRPEALLINGSRGAIVDTEALIKALDQNQLRAAAIDVFDEEPPLTQSHGLLSVKNTLLSPHIAYHTDSSMHARAKITFENVHQFILGQAINVVNADYLQEGN